MRFMERVGYVLGATVVIGIVALSWLLLGFILLGIKEVFTMIF